MQWYDAKVVGLPATIETAASVEVCLKGAIPNSINTILNLIGGVIHHEEPSQISILLERKTSLGVSKRHSLPVQSLYTADDSCMPQWLKSA